jgi:serine/threonine protein kinase
VELCDGNLNEYVKEWKNTNRPDIDRMVLGQIVVALQHLRSLNIVHKDLNPNNVLFKRTKCDVVQVKLADFGISKQKRDGRQDFSVTENKGTRGFISPELLHTGKPSFESDIWALGAVVYFIVSKGDHPYNIEEINEEFVNMLVKKLQDPPKVGDLLDWSAADLVRRLMAFEPEKRPNIFLVLLHPYFSAANEKTQLYLAWAINNFYIANKGSELRSTFEELFKEPEVRIWYENLETDWMRKPEDEEFIQSISNAVRIMEKCRISII